jgi:hypothetical protein
MMVVPEAWENTKPCQMTKKRFMSSILYYGTMGWPFYSFTDGNVIGGITG